MKISALLNGFNYKKVANIKTDVTSFGGNNCKSKPSFDGRSVGYHSEGSDYYGSEGSMKVVIDDYHHVKSDNHRYSLMLSEYYYLALHSGAEEALRNHPDLPKKYKIESCYSFNNPRKPERIYFADPGERITEDIRDSHAIVVHNFDKKGRRY